MVDIQRSAPLKHDRCPKRRKMISTKYLTPRVMPAIIGSALATLATMIEIYKADFKIEVTSELVSPQSSYTYKALAVTRLLNDHHAFQ